MDSTSHLRDVILPSAMRRFKELSFNSSKESLLKIFEEGGLDAVSKYLDARLTSSDGQELLELGVLIELCAQQLYSIDTTEILTVVEIIEAIEVARKENHVANI